MKKIFEKRGWTDKLFVLFTFIWLLIIVSAYILTVFSEPLGITDLSVINTIVDKASEIETAFVLMYVWKTKSENMVRMRVKDNIQM